LVKYYICFFFRAEDGIRVFHVTGVQTCALPISVASPLNDTPALSLKYSSLAAGGPLAAQLVSEQYDLALQVNKPGEGWVEPLGRRFVVTDGGSDPTKAEGIIEITGIGDDEADLSGVLGRTLGVAATYDADSGRWAFTSASAGRILRAYLDSHFSHRSIAPTFTASQDSAGQPWAIQFSRLELEPTRNALQI